MVPIDSQNILILGGDQPRSQQVIKELKIIVSRSRVPIQSSFHGTNQGGKITLRSRLQSYEKKFTDFRFNFGFWLTQQTQIYRYNLSTGETIHLDKYQLDQNCSVYQYNQSFYYVGGQSRRGERLRKLKEITPKLKLQVHHELLQSSRYNLSLTGNLRNIYASGGQRLLVSSREAEKYDLKRERAEALEEMKEPKASHASCLIYSQNELHNEPYLKQELAVFCPRMDKNPHYLLIQIYEENWRQYILQVTRLNLPKLQTGWRACYMSNEKVLLFGDEWASEINLRSKEKFCLIGSQMKYRVKIQAHSVNEDDRLQIYGRRGDGKKGVFEWRGGWY